MVEPASAVALAELITLAHKENWFDRLRLALTKKHRILVLGASGAGKSTFVRTLSKTMSLGISAMTRTQKSVENRLVIQKSGFRFIDVPGAEQFLSRRSRSVSDAVKDDYDGVINVVSYGYHELDNDSGSVFLQNQVSPDYLEARRKIELDQLSEWTTILAAEHSKWLITLVTKADLWWDKSDEVLKYYKKGPYFEGLGKAQAMKPAVLPYCSTRQLFYDKGPMSGFFSAENDQVLRQDFFATLLASVGKPVEGSE